MCATELRYTSTGNVHGGRATYGFIHPYNPVRQAFKAGDCHARPGSTHSTRMSITTGWSTRATRWRSPEGEARPACVSCSFEGRPAKAPRPDEPQVRCSGEDVSLLPACLGAAACRDLGHCAIDSSESGGVRWLWLDRRSASPQVAVLSSGVFSPRLQVRIVICLPRQTVHRSLPVENVTLEGASRSARARASNRPRNR